MPSIEENKAAWDGAYDWSGGGDEWSVAWGGPAMEWFGTILPRIRAHLPADTVLEIACGYGRWTRYLKDLCRRLVAVDISEECIAACRRRFSACPQVECHVNDGQSLGMIADSSVDFAFSFDSLVHADESVLRAYLAELDRVLREGGTAFVHHSNLGEYRAVYALVRRVPKLEGLLGRLGLLEKSLHGRDFSVDARKVERIASESGMRCTSQEVIRWGTRRSYIDCLSTLAKGRPPGAGGNRVLRNPGFMREARYLSRLARLYEQAPHDEVGSTAPAARPPRAGGEV